MRLLNAYVRTNSELTKKYILKLLDIQVVGAK